MKIVKYLGLQDYQVIYQAMIDFTNQRNAETEDELWVLEHFPVFTLGKAGKIEHLIHDTTIPVIQVDRGGQITYHGPGQLVIYTMINFVRRNISVHQLVDRIEEAIIQTLKHYDLVATKNTNRPGVYVKDKKIASLGLRIRNNGVYHGLSLNVDMDLIPFKAINPCGYVGLEMTQMKELVTPCPSIGEVSEYLVKYLELNL